MIVTQTASNCLCLHLSLLGKVQMGPGLTVGLTKTSISYINFELSELMIIKEWPATPVPTTLATHLENIRDHHEIRFGRYKMIGA